MIRAIYFLLILLGFNSYSQDTVEVIDATRLSKLKAKGVLVVDIRTIKEYNQGHISDAEHIDFFRPDFIDSMLKLGKNNPVIIHCAKGGRSGKAAAKLVEAGFVKVYDYQGGFTDWISKGLEIEK